MIIDNLPIEIDIESLLALSGYSDNRPAPKRLVDAAHAMIDRARDLASPRAIYEVHEKAGGDNEIVLGTGKFTGKILRKVLAGSDLATVYAVTLGPELDAESSTLSGSGDILSSVLLDTIGSYVLARASISLITKIFDTEAAPRGCAVTAPFGPGQCSWSLTEQRILFDLIRPGLIGITLTDTFLMIPKKSVSGIIGIGKADEIFTETPCGICGRKDCPGRAMFDVMGVSL